MLRTFGGSKLLCRYSVHFSASEGTMYFYARYNTPMACMGALGNFYGWVCAARVSRSGPHFIKEIALKMIPCARNRSIFLNTPFYEVVAVLLTTHKTALVKVQQLVHERSVNVSLQYNAAFVEHQKEF